MGLWGQPENFAVEGRGFRDEQYEEQVRVLLQTLMDEVGKGTADSEPLTKRLIDGERYKQIVGHVWWEAMWKTQTESIKGKAPVTQPDGSTDWADFEMDEVVYDGIDINWLPLDTVAVDLGGQGQNRRWAIKRIKTSVEALKVESKRYEKIHGRPLYKNLVELELSARPAIEQESYEEPRDTEHWPLTDDMIADDPGETKVELWICWDNVERTCTKIANRSIELDHGMADTPNGMDPFIGAPSVPIPGRVYGESMLHYTAPLTRYQTRIARARADEVLLNIWQQYLYREGSLRSSQWFWRPGGGMGIEGPDPDKPVDHDVKMLPRRPVFQEAYTEENYRQTQAEATAGADSVSQGNEATSKSRDVSATEISQRVMQGASRYQLEILYNKVSFQKVLLQKIFDLARANLTRPKILRILEDSESGGQIDLTQLERPIDIVVGGGVAETTQQERVNELRELKELGESPAYGPHVKHNEVVRAIVKASRTLNKNTERFVVPSEEVQRALQAQQQMAQTGAPGQPGALPAPPNPEAGGGPGSAGLNAPSGESPEAPASASAPLSIEI
jgi:hypothetical protein